MAKNFIPRRQSKNQESAKKFLQSSLPVNKFLQQAYLILLCKLEEN